MGLLIKNIKNKGEEMNSHYDFYEQDALAKKGGKHIENYLKQQAQIVMVKDVQDDPYYQQMDVDFVCGAKANDHIEERKIEVKVDTFFDRSKNYFFELVSNRTNNSDGCLMVTESDFLFYYFIEKELHIFKTSELQYWLVNNEHRFKKKEVKNKFYTTMGIIVPRDVFARECQVWTVDMKPYI